MYDNVNFLRTALTQHHDNVDPLRSALTQHSYTEMVEAGNYLLFSKFSNENVSVQI